MNRPQCEALSLKLVHRDDDTYGRYLDVQCKRKADATVYSPSTRGVPDKHSICKTHVGMLFVYGSQKLISDEPGYCWEIFAEYPIYPKVVRLNDTGEEVAS